jgi:hypothetical protein
MNGAQMMRGLRSRLPQLRLFVSGAASSPPVTRFHRRMLTSNIAKQTSNISWRKFD